MRSLYLQKSTRQLEMSLDTLPYMPEPYIPNVKMKSQCLSRRLAKEKVQCPGCKKFLQVATLAWRHKCKVPKHIPEDVVQQRLQHMRDEAAKSFRKRQETQNSSNTDAIDEDDTDNTQAGSE